MGGPAMHGRTRRKRLATAACLALLLVPASLCAASCGGSVSPHEKAGEVIDAATAFLDALGGQQVAELRTLMSQDYLDSNRVPDPITADQLAAVLGFLNSYRLLPEKDVAIEGERAVVTVTVDIAGKEEREETLVLKLEEGGWKVDAFTAMDWSRKPAGQDEERVQVEQALRDFLIACIDQDTQYIFEHLSQGYREKHRLKKPWTSAEFSGVFGTARSYDFDPNEIEMEDGSAEVDVTVEFGSRGNLESETARVRLVREENAWLTDIFPFFL